MLKQPIWNSSGMKMIVHTGHATFDRQTNDICASCNSFSNTHVRLHIRPKNDLLDCFGKEYSPGYMRDYDLRQFQQMSNEVRQAVIDATETEGCWVNRLFHFNGDQLIVHGWIITDGENRLIKYFVTGPTIKSWSVIAECARYLCEDWDA